MFSGLKRLILCPQASSTQEIHCKSHSGFYLCSTCCSLTRFAVNYRKSSTADEIKLDVVQLGRRIVHLKPYCILGSNVKCWWHIFSAEIKGMLWTFSFLQRLNPSFPFLSFFHVSVSYKQRESQDVSPQGAACNVCLKDWNRQSFTSGSTPQRLFISERLGSITFSAIFCPHPQQGAEAPLSDSVQEW